MTTADIIELLRALEWIWVDPPHGDSFSGYLACPSCDGRAETHKPDCRLALAIIELSQKPPEPEVSF
jgi:hypothetical protein